jgi:hypothetical protein
MKKALVLAALLLILFLFLDAAKDKCLQTGYFCRGVRADTIPS